MLPFTMEDFAAKTFTLHAGNPVLPHFGLSPLVADPSVLTPEESLNGKWQLFCHTLFGVYRFESDDGLRFANRGKVLSRAMRPDINCVDGVYYLYYERVQPFLRRMLAIFGKVKWFSEIFVVTSRDLASWTRPERVVACDRDYERCAGGISISNPFLLEIGGKRRLYFSAGLTYLDDCHFSEPTFISYADGAELTGGFVSRAAPIIAPDADDPHFNRCSGCIKVYAVTDGYIALQNGIYQGSDGKTHSAVMLLKSPDGEKFEFVKPLVEPAPLPGNDWMAQYVYASSLATHDGKLYLYFNARNVADPLKGRESIGLAIAGG